MLDRAAREHLRPCRKFCEIALLSSKSPGPRRARPGLAGGGEKAEVGQSEGQGGGRGLKSRRKEPRKRKRFTEHTCPPGVLRKGLLLLVLDLRTRNTAHPAGLPEPARATSSISLLRSRAGGRQNATSGEQPSDPLCGPTGPLRAEQPPPDLTRTSLREVCVEPQLWVTQGASLGTERDTQLWKLSM